ncbi:MAG: hypothetical protein M1839_006189 [Geoglossum umbratile]|nr:MAG: hypothetical protein M1839_006189 [Geoglossum umbratile]
MDFALAPFRVAVSKPAQRAYIRTLLFILTGALLLVSAIVAYVVFYYNYIPQIGVERVVHLQFGDGNPYGYASLGQGLVSQQAYDVYIHLHLPRSPPNRAAGNFMLDLSLISPNSATHLAAPSETDVLAHSRRPAILTYMSPLANIVNTIAEVPLLLLGFRKEAEKLDVRMMEVVEFAKGWRNVPNSLRLEVQADEKMQVYSTSVRFVARFTGLRWVMYNHRIISFLAGTALFWLIELSFTALAWITLSYYLTLNNAPTQSSPTIKPEPDETDSPLSSTPRTFPTFSRRPPLQYPTPRTTPGPDPSTGDDGESSEDLVFEREPALAGEADDEEEEEEKEEGIGEGEMFSVGRTAGLETRPTDSGIGTSMEEGRGRGLQRRRSRPA